MHPLPHGRLSRRTFLRAGAVSLSLPLLDAMIPSAWGAESRARAATLRHRRMVLIHRPLGTYHPYMFPEATGLKYEATRYLKILEPHRGRFTVISGMGHVGYPNSHHTESAIFTGVDPEGIRRADDIHNTVSLDQVVAEQIGSQTRLPHLVLNRADGSASLSWNKKGVPVPLEKNRAALFRRLFINGTPEQVAREIRRLETGQSILDGVREQLAALHRTLGAGDRARLDLLATSVREAEGFLQQDQAWAAKPKPTVEATEQQFAQAEHSFSAEQQWYTLVHLALQTDSTRVIVLGLGQHDNRNQPELKIGHHDASHHGKDPSKIEQLARYEDKEYHNFGQFLGKLADSREEGASLLDKTQVLFVSNLGDASAHSSDNLPVLMAGGGFRHQGHLAFDRQKNTPLSNLYVRMLQQMGLETDRFGSSTGVFTELG